MRHPQAVQRPATTSADGGTYTYKVTRLSRPEIVIAPGPYPRALRFDLKAGYVLAQNNAKPLIPYGSKRQEYDLAAGRETRQFLVHPAGGKVIVVNAAAVALVEYPGGKGARSAAGG